MKLSKCESGHFFDEDKYPACPYCNTELQTPQGKHIVARGGKTTSDIGTAASPAGPVTGWLVVMTGAAMGRDLRLGEGQTFLGLDGEKTPVTVSTDAPLSVRHAAVVYDPAQGDFTVVPGTAQELVYLNGKAVLAPTPLAADAVLRVSGTELKFVPFCGKFRWDQTKS